MCFRPTEISAPQICPNCGKKLQVMDGVIQAACPFCKTPLDAPAPAVAAPKPEGAPGGVKAPPPPPPPAGVKMPAPPPH